jgi:hypothetical protein
LTSWTLGGTAGANTLTASSSAGTVTFDATGTGTTATTLSAEPATSTQGDQVTFTASVISGQGTPTGFVSFRDNESEIGQGELIEQSDGSGEASFPTTALAAGSHSITAHYLGDGIFATSASDALPYSVASANVAPGAQSDAFNMGEDGSLNVPAPGVLANDNDGNGDNLTAVPVSGPAQDPNFILNSDGSFTYTPTPDFNGTDAFTYQASDGQASSSNAIVAITVNSVNDPPSFTTQGNVSTSSIISSVLGQTHDGWVTGIDPGPPDEDGQTVQFQVSVDNEAAFQDLPQIDASGNLAYRPQLTLTPIAVIASVVAQDSGGATSSPQSFTITINP